MKRGQMIIDEYVTVLHNVARDCDLGGRDQYKIDDHSTMENAISLQQACERLSSDHGRYTCAPETFHFTQAKLERDWNANAAAKP